MDTGEIIVALSRLITGGVAAFFAIMLWSRIRDIAWMLMGGGMIAFYGESLYGVLHIFGISVPILESAPLAAMVLSNIPVLFFTAAFLVMVIRSYRNR
ncbi:MAG: hypothetical protein LBH51_08235 [Treponema sp.]|jgi:hypothetical protein|nr:hypothetical protein [Treponema sp.]